MIELGMQLFSLRNCLNDDFEGTLKAISECGYTGVEFAGYHDHSPEDMKALLEKYKLKAIASHVGMDECENNLDFHIDYLEKLGCDCIVCPWTGMKTIEDAESWGKRLKSASEECAKRGFNFVFHNHGEEMQAVDGKLLFDVMMDNAGDLTMIQFDTYWIKFGNIEPCDLIRKYAGKVQSIHLKQMEIVNGEMKNCAFNKGIIDFKDVLALGDLFGVQHYIVEQSIKEEGLLETCKINAEFINSIRKG